ncbi:tail terminator [Vibrio phage vB_VpS_PG07]|uniref:Tail tube terminator protein n=1 Tax=Vibrio phage vB_VpS_PG07 TaxID=2301664 RepID=A0A385E7Q6_9CAUD|nr:tail terminator [Vibrio phage vB_VpS_PG07]AXQ66759.1 hypothetical protein [Vibrio phage vB_VpS_PG07]
MSNGTHRTAIASKFVEIIKDNFTGTGPYYTNVYGRNASTKILHFDEITDFPFISVVKSTERIENLPGGFNWHHYNMFIRVYISNIEDYDEELEKVISDLISLIDNTEDFEYTIENPDSSVTTHRVTEVVAEEIGTDEGLLAPDAMGEIRLRVRYETQNSRFC